MGALNQISTKSLKASFHYEVNPFTWMYMYREYVNNSRFNQIHSVISTKIGWKGKSNYVMSISAFLSEARAMYILCVSIYSISFLESLAGKSKDNG